MNKQKIRKGYETKVDNFEIKFYCVCGGNLTPISTVVYSNRFEYTLNCNKYHKTTNAKLEFNDYELFYDEANGNE